MFRSSSLVSLCAFVALLSFFMAAPAFALPTPAFASTLPDLAVVEGVLGRAIAA